MTRERFCSTKKKSKNGFSGFKIDFHFEEEKNLAKIEIFFTPFPCEWQKIMPYSPSPCIMKT